jgi:UDP-2-acetamido-2-deoxy-ribo-hexuluronate aminotransferase
MQFNDLTTQQNRIKEKLGKSIQAVMKHGQYIMGPEVKELEKRLSEYVGIKHAIACSSGTDALLLALMTYGISPGDAVFTTPFTFIATAEVISLLGATPVFVDIDPKTFNIDPVQLEKAILAFKSNNPSIYPLPLAPNSSHPTPKGVIPVDLFGLPADYVKINEIAKKHGLFVIEDAAQSFGAEYNGKKSCSLADVACTSFFPAKPLGCYGDGGMCFTDSDQIAEIMRSLLVHGKGTDKYDNVRIGINGRLDTLQAAILSAKFDIFPEEVELRDKVALRYKDLLAAMNFEISTPHVPAGLRSVWAQYSILAKDGDHRASLQKKLQDNKIPTAIYYPKPLHMQTAFSCLGYKNGDFPVSEDMAGRIFSLPMHPYLIESDQKLIADIIKG